MLVMIYPELSYKMQQLTNEVVQSGIKETAIHG